MSSFSTCLFNEKSITMDFLLVLAQLIGCLKSGYTFVTLEWLRYNEIDPRIIVVKQ